MNEITLGTRQGLGTYFLETGGEEENRPQIALASERFRAIHLSCRACGAMAMGAGLGLPVGDSARLRFHPQPPINRNWLIQKKLADKFNAMLRVSPESKTVNPAHDDQKKKRNIRWW